VEFTTTVPSSSFGGARLGQIGKLPDCRFRGIGIGIPSGIIRVRINTQSI
jgi:hypothetical protein